MSDSASNVNTALLVQLLDQVGDLREGLGSINARLDHGSQRFDDIDGKVDAIRDKQVAIEVNITPLVGLETRVKKMENLLGKKLAPVVAVSSAVIAVIMWIAVMIGGAVATGVKNWISTHFH